VADLVLRWPSVRHVHSIPNWGGGDFGVADPARAYPNEFTGENIYPYPSGLLGPRGGTKLLPVTGLPNHTIVPGPLGFWKHSNSPSAVIVIGNTPYEFPVAGGAATAWTAYPETPVKPIRFLTGAGIVYSLMNGKLFKHPNISTTSLITTPAAFSYITRWGYYFVAVDANVPWRIWFSTVDAAGAHFDQWGANDYIDIGDTEPITALNPIFNTLYVGKQTGWNAVSGVLGTLASVRGVALGQGPTDPRAVAVTTDNRIIYWPVERSPAFFNGLRVATDSSQQLVGPRLTSIGDTVLATATARRLMLASDDGTQTTLYTWAAESAWTRHTFASRIAAIAPADPRDATGMPEDVLLAVIAPQVVGETVRIVTFNHHLNRPGDLGDQWSQPGDDTGQPNPPPIAAQVAFPGYWEPIGRMVRVRSVIVQFRKWNMGGTNFMCELQLRVNSFGTYGGGTNEGELHRWFEPSDRNMPIGDDPFGLGRVYDAGQDDSWRVNLGEQGYGNGFQVQIPKMVGVALREVIALCDVRPERV
jgi:hypothetical protein